MSRVFALVGVVDGLAGRWCSWSVLRRVGLSASFVSLFVVSMSSVPVAGAATSGANWSIESLAYPSDFSVSDNALCEAYRPVELSEEACDTYAVTATNVGAAETGGTPVTLTDVLPAQVSMHSIALFLEGSPAHQNENLAHDENKTTKKPFCSLSPVAECVVPLAQIGRLQPDQALKMYVSVLVKGSTAPGALENTVSVFGGISGGSDEVSVTRDNPVEQGLAAFGVSVFDSPFVGLDGSTDSQAGGHPYELDTRIGLSSVVREAPEGFVGATSAQDLRDAIVDLPVGMAGSGVAAAQCTLARLGSKGAPKKSGEDRQNHSGCPADTVIGRIRTYPESAAAALGSIYNLVPEKGAAAEFGFIDVTGGTHVLYVTLAPTPEGYVLRSSSKDIPQLQLNEILVNVFGDPAASARAQQSFEEIGVDDYHTEPSDTPLFTNPENCDDKPLVTTVMTDSWQDPGSYNSDGTPDLEDPAWKQASYEAPPITGCEQLTGLFEPSIVAQAESSQADSPTGLNVNLKVPQHAGEEELATPPLKNTIVTLPEGMTVNPSSANGLEGCSLTQVGIGVSGVPNAAPPACPDGSKIGTVEVETPALPGEVCKQSDVPVQECPEDEREKVHLEGAIYVAKQNENPFDSLIAIYIVINDPRTGVIVKIPAKVELNPNTGRLTTIVDSTPQFPFSELRTHFYNGPTAALRTPPTCGTYTVGSELTPWSAPESGSPAIPSSSFAITQDPGGGACGTPGFDPSFTAGTSNTQAGAYTPFSVTFSRQDSEQELGDASITTPPGLLGDLKSVAQCPEPQASQGDCGPESLIGEATTSVGAGPDPYWVKGGRVYLTGPYNNGPFGLSIVVPTTAGPYTLTGNAGYGKEVVRASIRIDPHTAQVTVLSDPLPHIIEGIPLLIRTVNVTINRPGFMFNPTDCSEQHVTGSLSSTSNQSAGVSSTFYASNCASLPFTPSFIASTQAKTSKANGASLNVHITAQPGNANIAKVDVSLPKQLPSWLPTLQKACTEAQFNANPAGCPAASVIGTATAVTPVLAHPLSGPAYLVSHGGAAFPDVEIVLQGEGITLVLDGNTQIKGGVTYSKFETVPDAPVSTFELSLPQGPNHVLTTDIPASAKDSLCGQNLSMPTTITAQNGRVITQSTKITVTGCAKTVTLTRSQKLAAALRACRHKYKARKQRHQRTQCEKQARKRLEPKTKKKKPSRAKRKPSREKGRK